MNVDTCNCYLCYPNQARGLASPKLSSINKVWVWIWVCFRNDEAKKAPVICRRKKYYYRNLTVIFHSAYTALLSWTYTVKQYQRMSCKYYWLHISLFFLGTPGTPSQAEWLAKVRWFSYWGLCCLLPQASFPWSSSGGRKSPLNIRKRGLCWKGTWGMDVVM